ncbi:MAG: hypothetical protein AAF216_07000 [Pseudomonadota bacterium]
MLATTSLAMMACQGCVGAATAPDYLADHANFVEAAPASEGVLLATNGAFNDSALGSYTNDATQAYAGASYTFADRERVGPVLSSRMRILANEPLLDRFAPSRSPLDFKDALTDIEWSGSEALQGFQGDRDAARILQPVEQDRNFTAEFAFGAPRESTGFAFDAAIVPSVTYVQEGEFQTRRYGAELRLGRNFDQRGSNNVADSWYVFAGTEGEALVWEAGEYGMSNLSGAMALRDQVTVGDMQAGISMQRGNGQLSLSYIRREVEWRDRNGGAERNEDFAGISFTLRQ